ncbi:NVEALA domain-containing protein [Bacteroides sp.]|uniref:NVEALA domain-containing protein n=1 Tax=Bacteroides sp. TaxID=29523 RepID=UPI0023BB9A78|nr:NVEALA domain-containing protein [Bacteroides sp.]MDE6214914.1 NVEALA domain-containing protein [Bacteroides sp.]
MKRKIILIAAVIFSFCSYIQYRGASMKQLTNLQIANIEALASGEGATPVKIPCSEKDKSECKFLIEDSEGVWRHLIVKDMEPKK